MASPASVIVPSGVSSRSAAVALEVVSRPGVEARDSGEDGIRRSGELGVIREQHAAQAWQFARPNARRSACPDGRPGLADDVPALRQERPAPGSGTHVAALIFWVSHFKAQEALDREVKELLNNLVENRRWGLPLEWAVAQHDDAVATKRLADSSERRAIDLELLPGDLDGIGQGHFSSLHVAT